MHTILQNSKHASSTLGLGIKRDLTFVPDRWKRLLDTGIPGSVNHRYFELCVISCIANELRSGDVFIDGADSYGDYRKSLLGWLECSKEIEEFTKNVNIPESPDKLVKHLKSTLQAKASLLDKMYPDIADLEIDKKGRAILKKRKPKEKPASAIRLSNELRSRMPERNIIDIMSNCHHYAEWASVFAPISGSDPKLRKATEKYILTTFTYGTCLGPAEAARHIRADVSEKTFGSPPIL